MPEAKIIHPFFLCHVGTVGRKIQASYDISADNIRRCVSFITTLPPPSAPESPFFLTLGTPAQQQCPPLNSTLAQRTKEEGPHTV